MLLGGAPSSIAIEPHNDPYNSSVAEICFSAGSNGTFSAEYCLCPSYYIIL